MNETAPRLFLAVWPPASVSAAVSGAAARWAWPPGTRLTREPALHLTLHFIGAVETDRLGELRAALAVPFEVALDRAAVWRGGIAVMEPAQAPVELERLHARLAKALRACRLPIEARAYRPHVTLARHATGARPPDPAVVVHWRADTGYVLVRTLPGGRGYEPLAGFD